MSILTRLLGRKPSAKSAADGVYEVTDGTTTFTAYSSDVTYKENDSVYVTIPNGDITQQKQIVSKFVGENEVLTHISPLDKYVDITGNLCTFNGIATLTANLPNITDVENKLCTANDKVELWRSKITNGKDFERLAIKAEFQSWLSEFNTCEGHYGLILHVVTVEKGNLEGGDSEKAHQFVFDSDQMTGNYRCGSRS